eukprot:9795179-Karenia_brevis.AAC.1
MLFEARDRVVLEIPDHILNDIERWERGELADERGGGKGEKRGQKEQKRGGNPRGNSPSRLGGRGRQTGGIPASQQRGLLSSLGGTS